MNPDRGVYLRWFGKSCVSLQSPAGVHILIDPKVGVLDPARWGFPDVELVLLSHGNADHVGADSILGCSQVVCGVYGDMWNTGEVEQDDVTVTIIAGAYRDAVQGAMRGRTALISLSAGGIRFLHVGGLGHILDANLMAQSRGHDVLLLPFSEGSGLTALDAAEVVHQIAPRMIVSPHMGPTGQSVVPPFGDFLDVGFLAKTRVEHELELCVDSLPLAPELVVLWRSDVPLDPGH